MCAFWCFRVLQSLKVSATIAAVRSEKLTVPDSHQGQVYKGSLYSGGGLEELRTFDYTASDGLVQVWQHALILCDPGDQESPSQRNLCVLYHYTNELAFRNVANKEQTTAELFASLVDSRAHFGKGVYCTQHEPAAPGHNTVQRTTLHLDSFVCQVIPLLSSRCVAPLAVAGCIARVCCRPA